MEKNLSVYDALVIGAGVVGGFVARELVRYGMSTVIVEKENDVAMGATRANSAIVHAGFDAKTGSLKARLNVRGSQMMESVARELGVKYKKNGSLVVGFSEEDRRTLWELLWRGVANGVEGLCVLERDELVKIEPGIGDGVTCALYAPTGAIICPYELCVAAVGNAIDNGAVLVRRFEVCGIDFADGAYTVHSADGRQLRARYVINCAGVYSDAIAKMAGDGSFTVRARKGEYMLFDKECGSAVSHTVFRCPSKMGKGILVSPTVDGNLILGPTAVDIDDKEDTSVSAGGLAAVRAQASEQVRGLDFSRTITSFAGLRATSDVGDFVININDGFVNAAGIESPGLSSAPAIGEYVRELIEKSGEQLTLKPDFNPERRPAHYFRELDEEGKNAIIKEHPEFAHIICRCELVSEGEILEAIRTEPRPFDLDGVKRRTRATMGRCQGGFCTPYITELLAKENGIDYGAVTKFGGESYLNVEKLKEVGK